MQRFILAAALLAAVCPTVWADEKKDAKKEEKKKNLAALQKEFFGKFNTAGSAKARDEVMAEYAPKFLAIAESEKDTKDGLQATIFVAQIGYRANKPDLKKKAGELLMKHHTKSESLNEDTLSMLSFVLGKESKPLLTEIMKNGANDDVKKAAFTGLVQAAESSLVDAKTDEAKQVEKELADYRKIGVEKYKMKDLFIGATMPELKSQDLKGKDVKLSDYKGKVVVIDIWATWCPPCRAMIPHERKMVERLKGKPFELISVSFDAKKETLEKFLETNKMPWTHWWNGRSGEIGTKLGIRSYPTIYVLDGKGVIRFKGVRNEAMDKAVEKLLKEAEDAKKSS